MYSSSPTARLMKFIKFKIVKLLLLMLDNAQMNMDGLPQVGSQKNNYNLLVKTSKLFTS